MDIIKKIMDVVGAHCDIVTQEHYDELYKAISEVMPTEKINFKVFERGTSKDVTEEKTWLIDTYGYLNCLDMDYPKCPVQHMSDFYYYKITT